MKIIKRIFNNVVIFAGNNLVIENNACRGDGWAFDKIDVTLLKVETVDSIPDGFVGGGWTYLDGVWAANEIGEQAFLPEKRAEKISEFTEIATREIYADMEYQGHTFSTGQDSRALLAQILALGSVSEDMYWRDISNIPHAMTYADLQGFGQAMFLRGLAIDRNLMTKTAAINAAANAEAIESITW
ncbi:MAG: DUF4376 domain-containing protein [Nitrosomonadaceae bacterium]|nr:DUF4376 domain-containing protein [Nitrosomonadaceae bacterium]